MLEQTFQNMPCPVAGCNGQIIFNTYELLKGKEFTCSVCNSSVGLANESTEKVKETISELNEMRGKLKNKETQ